MVVGERAGKRDVVTTYLVDNARALMRFLLAMERRA
jgi:hypothetical protein